MSISSPAETPVEKSVRTIRTFPRFSLGQRWEHMLLLASVVVLLLTGLPQKYRSAGWSQYILSTPERVFTIRNIHHIAAIVLTLVVLVHILRSIYLLFQRKLPGHIFPTLQDVRDAIQMGRFLLFLTKDKPRFGKYNFEQKFTYWFLFFSILIMVLTGFILWFPITITQWLPGGVIPAAKLAHSTEAVITGIFIVIWHFYHVHFERLNLSIFTGWLREDEMRANHPLEYERLAGESADQQNGGDDL
jgi:formate dehydrogenase gamma subunit